MEMNFTEWVAVTDASSVGAARRAASVVAQKLGFDETRSGELAILATESSRNVLVHGSGGQVILAGIPQERGPMARILAVDKGAGIANVPQAMSDGFSTAGTMGSGLGAMKRIATALEIFTGRGGTVLMLELGQAAPVSDLQVAGVAVPLSGERFCGDAWDYHSTPERTLVLLADGIGHGREASEAAHEAIAVFREHLDLSPGEILSYVHDALGKTRGAVASIAEIRPKQKSLIYAGVGNISAVLLSGDASRSLVSHNGTLGMIVPRIQEFRVDWPADAVLVLHSDGLQSRWDLSPYAGLLARHPAVIAGALLRDFRRQRDDASAVVIKAA
ncbi:MAG TPA: SpoIIE family protein phosphatase [Terracidiphilus sp.]|jgi:anti-sigma regulatory factor (Ser/Thr protein kinase)